MKYLTVTIVSAFFCVSCSVFKPAVRQNPSDPNNSTGASAPGSPAFIDNISFTPGKKKTVVNSGRGQEGRNFKAPEEFESNNIEFFNATRFKYSLMLDVPVEYVANDGLYGMIDKWWGTPYRLGGSSESGVDCSFFVQVLVAAVYGINLPRTAREQKKASSKVKEDDLREGDLVFFNTGHGVSHVGLYLQNNRFVHASTSNGVMISDLNESYWSKHYIGGGRIM